MASYSDRDVAVDGDPLLRLRQVSLASRNKTLLADVEKYAAKTKYNKKRGKV